MTYSIIEFNVQEKEKFKSILFFVFVKNYCFHLFPQTKHVIKDVIPSSALRVCRS